MTPGRFAIVCLLAAAAPASAQSSSDLARLEQWLDAVRLHEPGKQDVPLETVASWSIAEVRTLWTDADELIRRMRSRNRFSVRVERGRSSFATGAVTNRMGLLACAAAGMIEAPECTGDQPPAAVADTNLIALSRAVAAARRQGDSDNYILRRGALLHADVAMLMPSWVGPVDDWSAPRQRYKIQIVDGQQRSFGQVPVHWQLARMLLDQVHSSSVQSAAATDPMVRLWYRATASWMQAHSDYDAVHLERAREIFSNDPDILFLSACLHETYAGGRMQNAIQAMVLPPGLEPALGSSRDELRRAERFLRRAVEARATLVEAQLHLGRVLTLLGRPAEAVNHLMNATNTDDRLLLYYAHLFLGAAHQALRQDLQARAAYERAAALYPRAQAPHLGLSQLARRRGDRDGALRAIQSVFAVASSPREPDDPWWQYYTSQGRAADELLTQLRRPFLSGDPQ